jgi:hypothetical protein
LERALLRMEGDPEMRCRFSSNAFIRYQQHHSPEHYLTSYLSSCEKVKT